MGSGGKSGRGQRHSSGLFFKSSDTFLKMAILVEDQALPPVALSIRRGEPSSHPPAVGWQEGPASSQQKAAKGCPRLRGQAGKGEAPVPVPLSQDMRLRSPCKESRDPEGPSHVNEEALEMSPPSHRPPATSSRAPVRAHGFCSPVPGPRTALALGSHCIEGGFVLHSSITNTLSTNNCVTGIITSVLQMKKLRFGELEKHV